MNDHLEFIKIGLNLVKDHIYRLNTICLLNPKNIENNILMNGER